MIALNAWHHIDRETREAIKRKFLPGLLGIYKGPYYCTVRPDESFGTSTDDAYDPIS